MLQYGVGRGDTQNPQLPQKNTHTPTYDEPIVENKEPRDDVNDAALNDLTTSSESVTLNTSTLKANKGKLLMYATLAPQNITFPTDLKLPNAASIKSEELIDALY